MVSRREQERAANYRKLQLLRRITCPRPLISFQRKRPSVIFDELKCPKQLKQDMERVHDADGDDGVSQAQDSAAQNPFPVVNVEQEEAKERFLLTVLSEAKCAGLLVFILEALEDVGLDVLRARVSCSDNFNLEAVVAGNDCKEREADDDDDEKVDAEGVKQEVLEAIQKWRGIRSDQTQENNQLNKKLPVEG